jgi:hypothetical protein
MPFDLRHLRFPITYHLTDLTSETEKAEQSEKVTAELVTRLRPILAASASQIARVARFIPRNATKNAAVFWDDPPVDLLLERPFGESPPRS